MRLSERMQSELARAKAKVAALKVELSHQEARVAFLEKSVDEARKFEVAAGEEVA